MSVMLSPYRVLDFTDHRGEIAAMMLHDLGAEVIKVEPPGGSSARAAKPLAPDGKQSLQFFAYNRGKQSVIADPSSETDKAQLTTLIASADFIFDSGNPGYLASYGLDFDSLSTINPHIVLVQLSPFGLTGPRADWRGSDLVIAAMGGPVALQGVPERPPVRLSVPQAWRHAGAEAAVAAMIAHTRMLRTGAAQFVDLSAQCAMTWTLLNAMDTYAIAEMDFQRSGSVLNLGGIALPLVHECADGYVVAITRTESMLILVPWMIEAGIVTEQWLEEDWLTWNERMQFGQPVGYSIEEVIAAFQTWIKAYTKAELLATGLEHGLSFAPVNNLHDMLAFEQLDQRMFWKDVTVNGKAVKTPGLFARPNNSPLRIATELASPGADQQLLQSPQRDTPHANNTTQDDGANDLPFAGLKVADFSWVGVGPISAKYLADHGATVVRIESEARPDVLRGNGPFKDQEPGINRSQFYGDFNTSKMSLQLDLKSPAAREIAKKMVAWADVVIESFTPGTMAAFGLGYETLKEINPSVIMVSTCLMGQNGPASSFAGFGYHAGAVAGFYDVIGWPDLPPVGPWVAYTDTIAPRFVATTLMAALDHRRRTGEGQLIDGAQLEMALHFLAPEVLDYQLNNAPIGRNGNRARHCAPQGVYPCAGEDKWVAIAVDTESEWQALCQTLRNAMGANDWLTDPRLQTHEGRLQHHDELDAQISEFTRGLTPFDAAQLLQQAGVPAGMVQLSRDLLEDPQYKHRNFYRYYDHDEMGHIPYAGHQFCIDGYDNGPRSAAPLIGAHLHEVLAGLLQMSDDEIAEAIADGALGF